MRLGADLAGDDAQAGRDQRLARDPAVRVLGQDGVEDVSLIWSAILSGWPSVTDSDVNVCLLNGSVL